MQHRKRKILLFGYLPPPVFGPSVAYQSLMRSGFSRHFDVTFVNLSVVTNIRDLESFRIGKLLKLVKFFLIEIYYLLTRRFDVCCYPIAYNRNAFLKDSILVGLARAFDVPVVLWAHGTGVQRFCSTLPERLRRRFKRMVGNAAGVLVLADCLRTEFAGLLPIERVYAVALGIEVPSDGAPERKPHEGLRILYLGALAETKGVFDLLQAMPLVRAQRPDVKLVVAGEWWRADQAEAARVFIREKKMDEAIEFIGPVTGAAKWRQFSEADILVFPSHAEVEAFGLVLLEAMQAGLPIVTTRGGARSEIIDEGVNGLLATDQNPADLAAKILQLANDPSLRAQMAQANKEKFAREFTHEHYGQRMIAVFERLTAP